ncbi:aminotransferase class V-fold PLP-dependent enzyme [Aneurinibacillus terranovensis]|uniref:aminotransferase class V-fold PLP-dependent enzyme n=1 Tax=Aneurinibacillus terranovensis TaxID=278991 RepID=UPI0009D6E76F|nr:aminotransferase class V-fold PLP-dependent enzyme [Aneurinibacillus terranovensis]
MSFRKNIIGAEQTFISPFGRKPVIYADWTATGRLYRPIESKIIDDFGPFIANTHTESNITGTIMTLAYKQAQAIIKNHVDADEHDVIIMDGSGMTAVVNKLQRILGLRLPETLRNKVKVTEEERPVIFVTHMEHHSNHTSWLETIGDVVIMAPRSNGTVNVQQLEQLLHKYNHRKLKIGSFTACSNVTGIQTPYHELARKMHEHGGICFVDFSASAPYVDINMHPASPLEKLDGIFFSPHKFLGGPGSSGVLIFDSRLYSNQVPDKPGGGTVTWTNPWGYHHYFPDIEVREDGGTPGILQGIKSALCIKLKEQMGTDNMVRREKGMVEVLLTKLNKIPRLHVLAGHITERLGIISFIVEDVHYNLIVKLLNDRFGIQVRGGCSCAGTYGHYLLNIDQTTSKKITDKIDQGDFSTKPGWVRFSIHPTMTNREIDTFLQAMRFITENIADLKNDYVYDPETNDYYYIRHKRFDMEGAFRLG